MDSQTRRQLLARIEALPAGERETFYTRARDMRDRQLARKPKVRQRGHLEEDEDAPSTFKPSLDGFLVRLAQDLVLDDQAEEGTVVQLAKGRAHVELGDRIEALPLVPELVATQQTSVAVGDRVKVRDGYVRRVQPRRTWLGRLDVAPGSRIVRAILANVDVIVVVVSCVAPPLHPRLIDRYLVAIQRGGAEAMVAVNKTDLPGAEDELMKLEPYRAVGFPIVHVSAEKGTGIDELRGILSGRTCAFVGHSGVGKSSLVNALRPELALLTGDISNGRGHHTTVTSSMVDLGDGTRIVDTPGIRSFNIDGMTAEEVIASFSEFEPFTCRIRGCTHTHEPNCGVRQAVEEGKLSEFRYETYLRLLEG